MCLVHDQQCQQAACIEAIQNTGMSEASGGGPPAAGGSLQLLWRQIHQLAEGPRAIQVGQKSLPVCCRHIRAQLFGADAFGMEPDELRVVSTVATEEKKT